MENESNKGEATDMFILLERDDDPAEGSNLCYQYGGYDYSVSSMYSASPDIFCMYIIFKSNNIIYMFVCLFVCLFVFVRICGNETYDN